MMERYVVGDYVMIMPMDLTGCTQSAKFLGVTTPCSIQGDFSLIDRKSEENGVAEAAFAL